MDSSHKNTHKKQVVVKVAIIEQQSECKVGCVEGQLALFEGNMPITNGPDLEKKYNDSGLRNGVKIKKKINRYEVKKRFFTNRKQF